jgi:hypothetical protein
MRGYVVVAGAFIAGIGVTCIFFLQRSPEIREVIKEVQVRAPPTPEACGPSKDILPPPDFAAGLPESLETNREAEVRVAWNAVTGAKSYNILVTDKRGRLVKKYSTTHTAIFLKEIPTPPDVERIEYKVFLSTVNGNDEAGEKNEGRDLKVNRQASVVAPTVKNIVVED